MTPSEPDIGYFVYPGGRVEIPAALAADDRRDRVLLTGAYCPQGHNLILADNVRFDDLPGIALWATDGTTEGVLTLSPFQGDPRKEGPDFPPQAVLTLSCPTCREPLTALEPCDCHADGEYLALFTVQAPDPDFCVGVCRRWDCFQSFVRDAGHLIVTLKVPRDKTG